MSRSRHKPYRSRIVSEANAFGKAEGYADRDTAIWMVKLPSRVKKIREVIHSMKAAPQKAVISKLNPIIRGWANYYSSGISRKYFELLDDLTHWKLWRWAKFRHPHKGEQWGKKKNFKMQDQKK